MKVSAKATVNNKDGIHARPSAQLVEAASKYKSNVKLIKNGMEANCKSVMDIMILGIVYKEEIEIVADGEDAEEALKEVTDLVKYEFNFPRDK